MAKATTIYGNYPTLHNLILYPGTPNLWTDGKRGKNPYKRVAGL
jgi:hypothetical protein